MLSAVKFSFGLLINDVDYNLGETIWKDSIGKFIEIFFFFIYSLNCVNVLILVFFLGDKLWLDVTEGFSKIWSLNWAGLLAGEFGRVEDYGECLFEGEYWEMLVLSYLKLLLVLHLTGPT